MKRKETHLVERNVGVPADETLDPLLVLFGDGAVPVNGGSRREGSAKKAKKSWKEGIAPAVDCKSWTKSTDVEQKKGEGGRTKVELDGESVPSPTRKTTFNEGLDLLSRNQRPRAHRTIDVKDAADVVL